MSLPALICLFVFNYLPMFGVILAFKNYNFTDGILKSPFVGLENFEFLFKTSAAFIITRNTLLYNAAFIVLGIVVPVFLSIILNEIVNRKLAKVYQTIAIMPYFLSWIVVGFVGYAFLNSSTGFLDSILKSLGLSPIEWYSEIKYWPFILTITQVWKSAGYAAVIYLAAITGISNEYYEAAVIDGASKWQQVKGITIPFLKPIIIILTILAIGKIFYADFGLFYSVPRDQGQLYDVTNVLDVYIYNGLKNMSNLGMTAAANFYQSILGFVLVLLSNLIVRKIDKEYALF